MEEFSTRNGRHYQRFGYTLQRQRGHTRRPDAEVRLLFQSTHVSNHGVYILRRETMLEPGLFNLDRRHHAAAIVDEILQLRVCLGLHRCCVEPGNCGVEEFVSVLITLAFRAMASAACLDISRLSRD